MDKKKSKQKKIRGVILWLICLVLLILAGAGTYAVLNTLFKKDETVAEQGEKQIGEGEEKIESVEEVETVISEEDESGGKKVKQYEGEDANKSAELTGVITYAGVNGGDLMIRTSIDQYLESGSCELQILRDGQIIYSESVNILADASTSTCQGFDVASGQLGNGAVQIIIKLSSGEKVGTLNGEANL